MTARSPVLSGPLIKGLACRCPRCGQGRLFRGLLTVADTCSQCGLDLKAADSGDGPAVFEFGLEPPFWVHAVLWPPLVIGASIGLLRPLKGIMIALQFHHQAAEHRHE